MKKTTKIILFSLIGLLIIGVAIGSIFLFGSLSTPTNNPATNDEVLPTINNTPQYSSNVINYNDKKPVLTLKCVPTQNDGHTSTLTIVLYDDGFVSQNETFSKTTNLHSTFQISEQNLNKVLEKVDGIKNETSTVDTCTPTYTYSILIHDSNTTLTSCDTCSSEIFDTFYQIKEILTAVEDNNI